MKNKLMYSFDDEYVSKFYYEINSKKIEIYFTGYYDLQREGKFIDKACIFVIKNWKEAKIKSGGEQKWHELNKHIGIFSIILSMELIGGKLEMLVITVDDRCITLLFSEPELLLK